MKLTNNLLNNQNYIIEKEIDVDKGLYTSPILSFLNDRYNKYKISNKLRYLYYRFLFFFGIYIFNMTYIKGTFWIIKSVTLKKPHSIISDIKKSFGNIDIDYSFGLSNKSILEYYFFENHTYELETNMFIYEIEYNDSMKIDHFLNCIGKNNINKTSYLRILGKENNLLILFTKVLLVVVLFFILINLYFVFIKNMDLVKTIGLFIGFILAGIILLYFYFKVFINIINKR